MSDEEDIFKSATKMLNFWIRVCFRKLRNQVVVCARLTHTLPAGNSSTSLREQTDAVSATNVALLLLVWTKLVKSSQQA